MKKAVIIIPTYNEAKNIDQLIYKIFEVTGTVKNWAIEVLVVDSSSPDGTSEVVEKLKKKYSGLHLLKTAKEGLGKAYVRGFRYALETLQAYVVFEMDADFSHDPKEIPQFLQRIEKGADFVIGSRYMKGGSIPKDWGLDRKIYSVSANLVIRLGFMNLKVTEWTNGYRAIKAWVVRSALDSINKYTGYVFQVALLDKAIKMKAKIAEFPIQFVDRTHGVSKINSLQYILQTFWYVFTESTFIKFFIVGGIGFVIDFGISYLFIERLHSVVWIATLISTESAIISNYFLNNFWSFAHKRVDHKALSYILSFLKFNIVSSGSIAIQTIGVQILTILFGKHWWYLYKIFLILFIIIPYSYVLYNKVIWKDR